MSRGVPQPFLEVNDIVAIEVDGSEERPPHWLSERVR